MTAQALTPGVWGPGIREAPPHGLLGASGPLPPRTRLCAHGTDSSPRITQKHGVDSEVPALGVLLPVGCEFHLGVSSIRDHVDPQCGDLKILVVKLELSMFLKISFGVPDGRKRHASPDGLPSSRFEAASAHRP